MSSIVTRTLTRAPRILIFGPPGAGKGTYSRGLEKAYSVETVSVGDLVRHEIHQDSPLGSVFRSYSRAGNLVPDKFILDMVFKKLELMGDNGIILDGFPRNVHQAEELDKIYGMDFIDCVFSLSLPDEVLMQANTGRRVCKVCKRSYNVADIHTDDGIDMPAFLPNPQISDECCLDPENMFTRFDDSEEVVRKRLDVYKEETEAVHGYFKSTKTMLNFVPKRGQRDVPKALAQLDVLFAEKKLLL